MALSIHLPEVQAPQFNLRELILRVIEHYALRRQSATKYIDSNAEYQDVPGRWRPNAVRGCAARQIYRVVRTQGTPAPFDLDTQIRFDRGHVYGAWVASYLKAAEKVPYLGVTDVEFEVVTSCERTGLGGKIDIKFTRHGWKYLIEVKSKDDVSKFASMAAPEDDHVAQLNDYMAMEKVHAGWILYIGVVEKPTSKDGKRKTATEFKDFFHRFDPAKWQETQNRVNTLNWFVLDQSKFPPKSSKTFLECPDCEFKQLCDSRILPRDAPKRPAPKNRG